MTVNKKLIFDEISNYTLSRNQVVKGIKLFIKHSSTIPSIETTVTENFGWRSLLLGVFVTVSVMLFVTRAFYLQVGNSQQYLSLSESNKTRDTLILAERGVIYSYDGKILARNNASFAVEVNRNLCADLCNKVIAKVVSLINLNGEDVKRVLDESLNKASFVIASNLTKDTALLIESNLYQLPGISVIVFPVRDYLDPFVFAHSIGYVGLDTKSLQTKVVGKSGVEEFYNDNLSGIPGRKISEVDSTGKKFEVVSQQEALPGRDLITYLDYTLSVKAYDLLKKIVEDKKAFAGAVVAQDPRTGGVLALVSYPSFNSTLLSNGISSAQYSELLQDPTKPFYNRAMSAAYPPGSTFKLITASAALSEGIVDRNTSIFDPGYLIVNGFRFNNWKLNGHGDVDIVRALQVSNDTFFYTLGGGYGKINGLGIEKLNKWAQRFGIGVPTGIDISGEASGNMPTGKSGEWYLGNTYITSIGQGDVLATALQMNNVMAYFGNGGKLMKPQIVKSIKGVKNFEPKIISQGLINSKNFEIVREGLNKAVSAGGTGYPVFDFPQKHNGIRLGGKTGTSEFIDSAGKPATHAWFSVFGPFDGNNASIALTVFLESGGAGSDDAAPIARELLNVWFAKSR